MAQAEYLLRSPNIPDDPLITRMLRISLIAKVLKIAVETKIGSSKTPNDGGTTMKRFGWILMLGAFCLGCDLGGNGDRTLIDNGVRTLVVEPCQYCAHEDEHRTHVHNVKLAKDAWSDFCAANPAGNFCKDFQRGFEDGFADFLDAGGTCEPPPIPPRDYWTERDCRQASIDWSAGFRTGAQLARRTGLRQVVVVPTGTCINTGAVPVYIACCQQPMLPTETVPAPAPRQVPRESVPSPSTMPSAPLPPVLKSSAQADPAAMLDSAPLPPQSTPMAEAAATTIPSVALDQDAQVEILPANPCFLNDSTPPFPDEINPFLTKDISGCSYESR
jgi:hypothetical protein